MAKKRDNKRPNFILNQRIVEGKESDVIWRKSNKIVKEKIVYEK